MVKKNKLKKMGGYSPHQKISLSENFPLFGKTIKFGGREGIFLGFRTRE